MIMCLLIDPVISGLSYTLSLTFKTRVQMKAGMDTGSLKLPP